MESNGAFIPFHGYYPRREVKEQDLISRLELGSDYESDEEVDCTLKLGLPSRKKRRTDAPNNIHAILPAPSPQNHGVPNGALGYFNIGMGNVGASNLNWVPMNTNGYYYYGSSSLGAVPAIPNGYNRNYPNGYNSNYGRYQTINVDMPPMRGELSAISNDRICVACGSNSTSLWRNGPRGVQYLCNACAIRLNEERMAHGHPWSGARARGYVLNGPGAPTTRA